ncbi:hypothetical protein FG386_002252 [Cryptosporidium ryanae]|uniref:uncharacterized protein n=1 Tax=Cryptosporidium ryanae TaxID=515981 RepID=UPI003519D874|nr:hypothetical protein FG386_002252 [Cryptosporidium ryanae]
MAVEVDKERKNEENKSKKEGNTGGKSDKNDSTDLNKTEQSPFQGKHNIFEKLFDNFGSNDDFKVNMENRVCMHCWILPSTLYCSTCMCFYCASCAHTNHVSAGSYHDIISVKHSALDRSETSKNLQLKQRNMCKRHKNKELTYCCTSCSYLMICETCIIIDGHGSHLLLTLSEATPRARQILLQSLSSLNSASFYMSQKILEITGSAEQRKNIFESNLLNVEDSQKSLTKAINSEEKLLFTELSLLSNKLERGGEDIIQSCVNLKEILVSICGEVSIILQLAKDSPSHALNRYVKISNVVKGTLDPNYKVFAPELQHLSVPYWNLNLETINEILEDTDKYTQEHTNHAIKLSDAIKKISMGDLSVVEEIGPINVKVYGRENVEDRSKRARVHKIFTNKLKVIQNDKLKNITNPLTAPKSAMTATVKTKVATRTKNDLKIQEWLGLRNWKGTKQKKSTNITNKKNEAFKVDFTSKNENHHDDMNVIKALSDSESVAKDEEETKMEIFTIGRDKSLEVNGRSKEEKMLSEEYYESQIHFSGDLMGVCVYSKERENKDLKLTKIAIKYCFPFIILYDPNNMDQIYAEDANQTSPTILKNTNQVKNNLDNDQQSKELPVISPGILKINIPIFFGRIERPKNSLFIADVRQTNIRIQSIHSNSVTPETSRYLGAAETEFNIIQDGFEISNVMGGNTIEAWIFSCKSFDIAEKWISMLRGEDNDVKSCIFNVGAARLCIKTLSKKGSNIKIAKSNVNKDVPLIDVVPKNPENEREKLLFLAQSDHHYNKETLIYEDEDGSEYYEERELDIPDLMSIRLNRKLSRKMSGKSGDNLLISSILRVGKDPVIHLEKLHIIFNKTEQMNQKIALLTKSKLYIASQDNFDKNLSHDVLLDEYSISEAVCSTIISVLDKTQVSNIRALSTSNGDNCVYFGFECSVKGDKSIIFICPNKQSENIWMNQIYNSEKKKPLKYWKQILDGTIVRKSRSSSRSSLRASKLSFGSKIKSSNYSELNSCLIDCEEDGAKGIKNTNDSVNNSSLSNHNRDKRDNSINNYDSKARNNESDAGFRTDRVGSLVSSSGKSDINSKGNARDYCENSSNQNSRDNSSKELNISKSSETVDEKNAYKKSNQTLNVRFEDKWIN